MNIVDLLRAGKENSVTRQQLCAMTGLPDRTVRRMIASARNRGEIIISNPDGGYYLSDDEGELKRQYKTNRNRALSILRQQRHIRRRLREIEQRDQVTMEEVSGSG